MHTAKPILLLVVLSSVVATFALGKTNPTPATALAPSFTAQTLGGQPWQFDPASRQKPTLLLFWASWCQSCHYEIAELLKLYEQLHTKVDIVGISVDIKVAKAQAFINKTSLPYPNLIDSNIELAELFKVNATPTIILVDQHGRIQYRGDRLNKKLKASLEQLAN